MRNAVFQMFVIACLVLAACATTPSGHQDLLDFLKDGVTRREDVELSLGEPSRQYEESRILAYRLRKDEGGYVLVAPRADWYGVRYSLILVFDSDEVLGRHALVEVRSP